MVRLIGIFLLLPLLFAACMTAPVQKPIIHYPQYDIQAIVQKVQQAQSTSYCYQQWIILAAYIITTLATAIYTRHANARIKNKVKQQAVQDLPFVIRLLKALIRRK